MYAIILALSMAGPVQAPRPPQAPPVKTFTVRKTCLCSGLCECGCNDGQPCNCRTTITSGPEAAPVQAVEPSRGFSRPRLFAPAGGLRGRFRSGG
jgi:hypothetical protein